jgi:hypothetical protein
MDTDICYCPTVDTEPHGYLVNLLPHRLIEVHFMDNHLTREVTHSRPGLGVPPTFETILLRGLIRLSTSDITYTPLSDLSSMFPLRVGDEYKYSMRLSWSGRDQHSQRTRMRVLRAVTQQIGRCQYELFKIDITLLPETESKYEAAGPGYIEYYCPALRHSVYMDFGKAKSKVGTLHPLSELDAMLARLRTTVH